MNFKTTCFTYWGDGFLVGILRLYLSLFCLSPFPLARPCRLSAFTSKGPPQNSVPLELASLRERTFLAYSVRTWKGRSFLQIYKKQTFPFLSLSPLSVRVKRSEVLSDDVTVIVEIKECERTGFSSSKHKFSKPTSFYRRKEKMVPSWSLTGAGGIFHLICPAWRLGTLLYSHWMLLVVCIWSLYFTVANCATRKFQRCNLNPRSFITERCLFFLNMRIINVIR